MGKAAVGALQVVTSRSLIAPVYRLLNATYPHNGVSDSVRARGFPLPLSFSLAREPSSSFLLGQVERNPCRAPETLTFAFITINLFISRPRHEPLQSVDSVY